MNRIKIVAGNWKMNKNLNEGNQLVKEILNTNLPILEHQKVIFAPPYIHLSELSHLIKDKPGFYLAAQNCHQKDSGSYTGEISAQMLKDLGVDFVILGHSERRQYFGEDETLLAEKTNTALAHGLQVIFCVGESLEIRENNTQEEFVETQIKNSLFHLGKEEFSNIILAYEPIWAIGTGKTASKEQAQEMHAHIRNVIAKKYGNDTAEQLTILYGGSCNPKNAKDLFSQPDVDGGLIGGASLKSADFCAIIEKLS